MLLIDYFALIYIIFGHKSKFNNFSRPQFNLNTRVLKLFIQASCLHTQLSC